MPEAKTHYGQALVASHLRAGPLRGSAAESMDERRRALGALIGAIRTDLREVLLWMRMQPGVVGLSVFCETTDADEEQTLRRHLLDTGRGVYLRFDDEKEYRATMEQDRRTEQLLRGLAAGEQISPRQLEDFFAAPKPPDDQKT